MFKITVKIEGLMCPMCEKHMNEAFAEAFATENVTSSHKNKESIIITDKALSDEEIKSVVEKAGYTFVSAESEPYEKKSFLKKLFGK